MMLSAVYFDLSMTSSQDSIKRNPIDSRAIHRRKPFDRSDLDQSELFIIWSVGMAEMGVYFVVFSRRLTSSYNNMWLLTPV